MYNWHAVRGIPHRYAVLILLRTILRYYPLRSNLPAQSYSKCALFRDALRTKPSITSPPSCIRTVSLSARCVRSSIGARSRAAYIHVTRCNNNSTKNFAARKCNRYFSVPFKFRWKFFAVEFRGEKLNRGKGFEPRGRIMIINSILAPIHR